MPSRVGIVMIQVRSGFLRKILPGLVIVSLIELASIIFVEGTITKDAATYMRMAVNLRDTGMFSYDGIIPSRAVQPLYPFLLYALHLQLGFGLLLIKVLQALMGLTAFVLTMLVFREIAGSKNLLIAGIVIGAYVPLWINCTFFLTEMTSILLLAMFMYFFIKGLNSRKASQLIAAGLVLGLAVLTRAMFISTVSLIWLPILFSGEKRWSRLRSFVLVLIGLTVVVAPWSIRNAISCDSFSPVPPDGSTVLLYASEHSPEAREYWLGSDISERDALDESRMQRNAIRNILSDPLAFLWRGVKRIAFAWSYFPGSRDYFDNIYARVLSYSVQAGILILALIGLAKLPIRQRILIAYPPISFTLLFLVAFAISRYVIPTMPLVLMATVGGLVCVKDYFVRKQYTRSLARTRNV